MWVRVKAAEVNREDSGKGKKKNQASDFRQTEILKVKHKRSQNQIQFAEAHGQVLMTSQHSLLREVLQFELSRQTRLFYQQENKWNILKIK